MPRVCFMAIVAPCASCSDVPSTAACACRVRLAESIRTEYETRVVV